MAKLKFFLVLIKQNAYSWCFHFKGNIASSKKRYLGFLKQPSIWEVDMFLCDKDWKFWMFSVLSLCNKFSEKRKTLYKKLEYQFLVEGTKIETQHLHAILLSQRPMLRQIEWRVQNKRSTKNGVLRLTVFFFFRKFCCSWTISHKELISCTKHPNVHIHTYWFLESVGVLFEGAFSLWVSLV